VQDTAAKPFIDVVRRRKDTAARLGVSVRTLDRIPAQQLPKIRITDRLIGHRESDILRYLHERTIR
jgi:predicted DNA-binding transcriptional regulator AlpA